MRNAFAAAVLAAAASAALAGCSTMTTADKRNAPVTPSHPAVVIQGVDGTTMAGELLNGSITVDSGQGELTLLTDHVHYVTIAPEADKLDSDSIQVTGKIKDTRFFLKNEHGVFTLAKDRLRRIEFVNNQPKAGDGGGFRALAGTSSRSTATVRSAGAAPAPAAPAASAPAR